MIRVTVWNENVQEQGVKSLPPEILEKINGGIVWKGRLLTGREAAEILVDNQLRGIEKAAGAGISSMMFSGMASPTACTPFLSRVY